jgi:hypothetical protein
MLDALSAEEREVIRRALDAAVNGPFFPDWEFSTLFGVARAEAAASLARFPDLKADTETDYLAVHNAIANLLGYPHGRWAELEARGLSQDTIRSASHALKGNDDVSIQ